MRSILTAIFLLVASFVSADTWETHWTDAIQSIENKQWLEAETQLTTAIQMLELAGDHFNPHVYVDRARLYCHLDKYPEALEDVSYAIDNEFLGAADQVRAILTRMHIYAVMNDEVAIMQDYNLYRKLCPNKPTMQVTDDRVIIRNTPDCKCFREMMTNVLVISGMCEKNTDIKWLKSGICIAKRHDCGCGCGGHCDKQALGHRSECDYWCDKGKTASLIFCQSAMKTMFCQGACIAVVEMMADACYWCCAKGNFYDRCLKCFDDLLKRIGEGCDPAFN